MVPAFRASFAGNDRHVASSVDDQSLLLMVRPNEGFEVVITQSAVSKQVDISEKLDSENDHEQE